MTVGTSCLYWQVVHLKITMACDVMTVGTSWLYWQVVHLKITMVV